MNNCKSHAPLRIASLLFLGVAAVYLLGTVCGVLLVPIIEDQGGLLSEQLLRKGPDKLTSRLTMFWLIVFIPFLIRAIGWKGKEDLGYHEPDGSWSLSSSLRDVAQGVGMGVVTLGLVASVMVLFHGRGWSPEITPGEVLGKAGMFFMSCMVVAVLEETIARGILFRSLARVWTAWSAALVISFLFALAHFLEPSEAAFGEGGALQQTGRVLASMGATLFETHDVGIRMLNLTLMSLALCAFVMRTGTIWLAVGTHAAWVWTKRMNGFITDSTAAGTNVWWLGQKSDGTDSVLCAILLLALLVWAIKAPNRRVKLD